MQDPAAQPEAQSEPQSEPHVDVDLDSLTDEQLERLTAPDAERATVSDDPSPSEPAVVEDPAMQDPAAQPEARAGYLVLRAPPGASSCSVAGEPYTVDADGLLAVKPEHAAELLPFGYQPHTPSV